MADRSNPGYMPEILGSFTTPADMVAWLAEQYGLVASVTVPGGYLVTEEPFDGWIEHQGGERPVISDQFVKIKFRDGSESAITYAKAWDWSHRPSRAARDIVAYRLV